MKLKLIYCSEWNNFESENQQEVFDNDIKYIQNDGRYIEGHTLRTYIPKEYKNFKGKLEYSSLWEIISKDDKFIILHNGKEHRLIKGNELNSYDMNHAIQIQNDNFYNLFVTNKTLCKALVLGMYKNDIKKPAKLN